jgi:hypothetical protein
VAGAGRGAALRGCSRRAIVAAFAQDHQGAGLSQSLAVASVLADAEMLESLKSADFREGVRHFVEHEIPPSPDPDCP